MQLKHIADSGGKLKFFMRLLWGGELTEKVPTSILVFYIENNDFAWLRINNLQSLHFNKFRISGFSKRGADRNKNTI